MGLPILLMPTTLETTYGGSNSLTDFLISLTRTAALTETAGSNTSYTEAEAALGSFLSKSRKKINRIYHTEGTSLSQLARFNFDLLLVLCTDVR